MIRIPYGTSYFSTLIGQGYYYVDRTAYLARLEDLGEKYLTFLRPRRFGKSLWLSTLAHYYGREHAGNFEALFGNLYIGQNPTPLANSYLVVQFDFSGVDTHLRGTTLVGFVEKVRQGIRQFFQRYPGLMDENTLEETIGAETPAIMLGRFLTVAASFPHKLYVLIDEYDHFTNQLLSFDLEYFREIVSSTGWVRSFYEVLKTGAMQGTVDRIFMTGISPVTLDNLTSGFNIGTNLSLDPYFHGLLGFTAAEVEEILRRSGGTADHLPGIMTDLKRWYNGYTFSAEGQPEKLYNPDMVLFFAKEYQKRNAYPPELLDTNIASDYGRIRNTFRLGNAEFERHELLRKILAEGQITTALTRQFSFERRFTAEDFLSLLYYMGLLTIQGEEFGTPILGIPNLVVEKLYFDYFRELLDQGTTDLPDALEIQGAVFTLARSNDPAPLMALVTSTLEEASARDFIHLNETGVKMVLMSFLHASQIFFLRSEHEESQNYVDLLLLHKPPIVTPYQFVFELKYLKKKDATRLETAVEEGRTQLRRYFSLPELQSQPNLRAWLFVFVGTELRVSEEVMG